MTVLDTNEKKVRSAVETYDVNGICGNGCIADDLKEAGAATAGMIVAVTPSDEQNVLCCMIAKSLGVKYAVARVRDPAYSKQIDFMREKLGVDRLVNPERALAEEVGRILRFPSAEQVYSFGDGKAEIVEMTLPAGCALCGKKLSEVVSRDKKIQYSDCYGDEKRAYVRAERRYDFVRKRRGERVRKTLRYQRFFTFLRHAEA